MAEQQQQQQQVWRRVTTADGTPYYVSSDGRTAWSVPEGARVEDSAPAASSVGVAVATERVDGTEWTETRTSTGMHYWTNTETKQSVWEQPEAVAAAREAAILAEQGIDFDADAYQQDGSDDASQGVDGGDGENAMDAESDDHADRQIGDEGGDHDVDVHSRGSRKRPRDELIADLQRVKAARVADVSPEAQFRQLLAEKGVDQFSKWVTTMPKLLYDPRFKALPTLKQRKAVFQEFVANPAGSAGVDAAQGFRDLLQEADSELSADLTFDMFQDVFADDPRFVATPAAMREAMFQQAVAPKIAEARAQRDAQLRELLLQRRRADEPYSRTVERLAKHPVVVAVPVAKQEAIVLELAEELRQQKLAGNSGMRRDDASGSRNSERRRAAEHRLQQRRDAHRRNVDWQRRAGHNALSNKEAKDALSVTLTQLVRSDADADAGFDAFDASLLDLAPVAERIPRDQRRAAYDEHVDSLRDREAQRVRSFLASRDVPLDATCWTDWQADRSADSISEVEARVFASWQKEQRSQAESDLMQACVEMKNSSYLPTTADVAFLETRLVAEKRFVRLACLPALRRTLLQRFIDQVLKPATPVGDEADAEA